MKIFLKFILDWVFATKTQRHETEPKIFLKVFGRAAFAIASSAYYDFKLSRNCQKLFK